MEIAIKTIMIKVTKNVDEYISIIWMIMVLMVAISMIIITISNNDNTTSNNKL